MRPFGHNNPLWRGIASPPVSRIGATQPRTVLSAPALIMGILAAVSAIALAGPANFSRSGLSPVRGSAHSVRDTKFLECRLEYPIHRGRHIGVDEILSKTSDLCALFWFPANGLRFVVLSLEPQRRNVVLGPVADDALLHGNPRNCD